MSKTGLPYPGMRELKLTTPRQQNPTVRWLQTLINVASPRYVRGLEVDGVFGIHTGNEVEAFCYRMGRPGKQIPALGIEGQQILWGWDKGEKLPTAWRLRRIARMAVPYKLNKGISALMWRLLHPGSYPVETDLAAGLAKGRDFAGLKEDPRGSNHVPELEAIARRMGVKAFFANMGYAWCAFYFYLAHLMAGNKTAKQGLVDGAFWPLYTPTIQKYAIEGRFGHKAVPLSQAKPGMGVLFDFDGGGVDHIGMYISHTGDSITTIDGNTSVGNESNGGQVMVRTRSISYVRTIFTIA